MSQSERKKKQADRALKQRLEYAKALASPEVQQAQLRAIVPMLVHQMVIDSRLRRP